ETVCARTATNRPLVLADGTITSFTQQFPNGLGGTQDNKCDPSGGFSFTQNTLNNFGKITTKRGQRVIELALKFTF
ncbi:MAG TPA: hypothetical protein PKD31_21685, partial [Blastocatellia bacterium]|nr:hypothetical protein [Blastocatellia bacterium]